MWILIKHDYEAALLTIALWHACQLVNFGDICVFRYYVDVFLLDQLSNLLFIIVFSFSFRLSGVFHTSVSIFFECRCLLIFFLLLFLAFFALFLLSSIVRWLLLTIGGAFFDLGLGCFFLIVFLFEGLSCTVLNKLLVASLGHEGTMLEFLMLGEVESLHLLRTCEGHSHLTILFILISVLLFHLADLGMLASLDFALIHELIVVFLLSCLLIFPTLFATFVILLLIVLLLVTSLSTLFTSLFATASASSIIVIVLLASVFSSFVVVLSRFFTDLYDCDFAIVIEVNHALN